MDSSNCIKSIQFFENLTVFPQLDVCKQLDSCSLVVASMFSEQLEQVVKMRKIIIKSVWEITLSKNVLMIYLKFKDKTQNFQIGFKEDPDSSEDFYVQHDRCWNSITFCYKRAQQLEASSFKALQLLSNFFPPLRFHRITVPLGPRCPDFPFRFLSKLPRAPAKYADLQADQEVDFGDLTTFLKAVKYTEYPRSPLGFGYRMDYRDRLNIRVRVKNMVPCDEISLRSGNLEVADARFLTHESIQQLDVNYAEIGENNFTSKDFNAVFRSWMAGKMWFTGRRITFHIREDQKIKMEEVMEGLNAHVGKPRLRDRWRVHMKADLDFPTQYAIDCDKGWDISDNQGYLATVLLEPNRLSFISFDCPFSLNGYKSSIQYSITFFRGRINNMKSGQEKLERKIARRGVNPRAEDLNKLIWLAEEIERCDEHVDTCLEELERCKLWSID